MPRKHFDLGDRASGRVVDDQEFLATKPARYATGVVTTIYPQAPRIVGITYSNGETCTIRVSA